MDAKESSTTLSLIRGVQENNPNEVKRLLQDKADVNGADEARETALMHWAACNGSTPCLQLLLEHKADLHAENANGQTALMIAHAKGHQECEEQLLRVATETAELIRTFWEGFQVYTAKHPDSDPDVYWALEEKQLRATRAIIASKKQEAVEQHRQLAADHQQTLSDLFDDVHNELARDSSAMQLSSEFLQGTQTLYDQLSAVVDNEKALGGVQEYLADVHSALAKSEECKLLCEQLHASSSASSSSDSQHLQQSEKSAKQAATARRQAIHAIRAFMELFNTYCKLCASQGELEVSVMLRQRLLWISALLKRSFSNAFREALVAMKWPQTTRNSPLEITYEGVKRFSSLFVCLLDVQLVEHRLTRDRENKTNNGIELPPLWAMDLLVEPIQRRFQYHFDGKRKTNQMDKPSWFLSFGLSQITFHEDVLNKGIQYVIRTYKRTNLSVPLSYDVKIDFVERMIAMLRVKVLKQLAIPKVTEDLDLFCVYVNELLSFEVKLREDCCAFYPPEKPGLLAVLCENTTYFNLWLKMEREYVNTRLELIRQVTQDTKWHSEEDEHFQPRNAKMLVQLLAYLKQRFQYIPQINCQWLFAEKMQVRLVQLFLDECEQEWWRLVKVSRKQQGLEKWQPLLGILNAHVYLKQTLEDWSDESLFVVLSYYNKHRETTFRANKAVSAHQVLAHFQQQASLPEHVREALEQQETGERTPGMLDALLLRLDSFLQTSIDELTPALHDWWMRNGGERYCLEGLRWVTRLSVSTLSDAKNLDEKEEENAADVDEAGETTSSLSPLLLPALSSLRALLLGVHQRSHSAVFHLIWRQLAHLVDDSLSSLVADRTDFSRTAANRNKCAQFQSDINAIALVFRSIRESNAALSSSSPDAGNPSLDTADVLPKAHEATHPSSSSDASDSD